MSNQRAAPEGCLDPARGGALQDYLDKRLSPDQEEEFEGHYAGCEACLLEIQLQQTLPQALQAAAAARRSRAWRLAGAGAALAAAAAVFFFILPGFGIRLVPGAREPVVLQLEGLFRDGARRVARAPAGRPIELSLFVPVPERPGVSYDVEVTGAGGETVFAAAGVRPAGPSEVRVRIEDGIRGPGRYEVTVSENGADGAPPITLHFNFDVTPG